MKKTFFTFLLVLAALSGYAKPDFEIPEIEKYVSAEQCRKDNDVALKTAKYYLEAKLPDDVYWSQDAARYVILWISSSEDIMVTLDEKIQSWMKCENTAVCSQLFAAYLSGCVIYCLEHKQRELNFDMHYFALSKMLDYYDKNKSVSGSDKVFDDLLKSYQKGKLKAKEQKKFE